MNGPFQVAQATGIATSSTTSAPVRIYKLTKPLTDQAVIVNLGYDQKVKVDFSAIANEKITLVHVGEKLIILFDNESTVTVEPFFKSRADGLGGDTRDEITVEMAPGRDISVKEFAALFPITTDTSVLPAADQGGNSNGNAQASGANFSPFSVDPLDPVPLNQLAPQEELGNFVIEIPTGGNVLPDQERPDELPPPVNTLSIVKETLPGQVADVAGETLNYTITIANTGNTTLTGVVVSDPNADPGSVVRIADVVGDNDALLEVGETWAYTAVHTVTQAEIDSNGGGDGDIDNVATADSDQSAPDTDEATVPVGLNPGLNIVKEAVPGQTADAAGETLNYTITIANTGNATLTGVVVSDPNADPGSVVRIADVVGDNDALLEVGETWAYTAVHTVTQAEIDSNGGGDSDIDNVATAGSNETGLDTDDATVPVARAPALNIVKDVASVTDGPDILPGALVNGAGDVINYTITVANTGNTTLTGVAVTDPYADAGSIVRGPTWLVTTTPCSRSARPGATRRRTP